MIRTLSALNVSPARTSVTTYMDGRSNSEVDSEGRLPYTTLPIDAATRAHPSTSSRYSLGSMENDASTPPRAREIVTCFSMTHAPSAVAAKAEYGLRV